MKAHDPHRTAAALAMLGLLVAAACEQAFEPLHTPEDLHFSIYGFLDASNAADTQWVRVARIRTAIDALPEPVDAAVTLEKLGSGHAINLRDSVFTYPRELGSDLVAYNYWTTEAIDPDATYRLTATRPDGISASATVTIPPPFPETIVVEVTSNPMPWAQPNPPDIVEIDGVEHLGLVEVLHHIPETCQLGFAVYSVRQPIPHEALGSVVEEGLYRVPVSKVLRQDTEDPLAQNPVPCDRPIVRHEVRLVATGSQWPEALLQSGATAHMNLTHNVENAVGFMDGVITTTVPLESCTTGVGYESCRLIYSPKSASLQGALRDRNCDEKPMDDPWMVVVLKEIKSGRVRTAGLDEGGAYTVGALVPGMPYEVTVEPQDGIAPYADTLVFEVGEQAIHDVHLRTFSDRCPES